LIWLGVLTTPKKPSPWIKRFIETKKWHRLLLTATCFFYGATLYELLKDAPPPIFKWPDYRIAQMAPVVEENRELQAQIAALTGKEPDDSLRHKTLSIANAVQHYLEERAEQHPAYAYPDSRTPNPTAEQKQKIAACLKYDGETWTHYRDIFIEKMVAIAKEYDSKGVQVGYLQNGLTQHPPWVGSPGMTSVADVECMQDLCKFKELAYHVDAKDARIDLP